MSHTATPEEFFDAFARLDEQQKIEMMAAARHYAQGNTGFSDGHDLLNELIVRVVEGRRRWSVDAPLMAFLVLGLRSVANGGRRLACNKLCHVSLDGCADDPDIRAHRRANPHPSAEEEMSASQDRAAGRAAVEFARRSLVGDPLGQQVLEGMACDLSPSEIRSAFGIGKLEFHAARGRVNSRLAIWAQRHGPR